MSEQSHKIPYELELPLLDQQVIHTLGQKVDASLENDEVQTTKTVAHNAQGGITDGSTIAFQTTGDGRPAYHDRSRSLTVLEEQKSGQDGAFSIRDGYSETSGLIRKGTLDIHADISHEDRARGTEVNRYSSARTTVDRRGRIKQREHTAQVQKFSKQGAPKGHVSQEYFARISPRNAEKYGRLITSLALKKAVRHTPHNNSDVKIEKTTYTY